MRRTVKKQSSLSVQEESQRMRAEIKTLRENISRLVLENPEKGARILTHWLHPSPKKDPYKK